MKKLSLASLVLALLAASGCQQNRAIPEASAPAAHSQEFSRSDKSGGDQGTAMVADEASKAPASPTASQVPPVIPVPQQRKIIRNGSMSLEVASIEKTVVILKQLVTAAGGYAGNETQSQNEYQTKMASITCRVPAGNLDALIDRIKGLGTIEDLSISAEDITEQYYDLQVRINNQKKLESSLLELLNRQTNQLSDLLEIEREVARVRGEIDGMEGRIRFWDSQAAFSTIVVNMHEPRPAVAGGGGGFFRTLFRAFHQAAENFIDVVAGIIALSGGLIPILVIIGFILWVIVKLWRRRKSRG